MAVITSDSVQASGAGPLTQLFSEYGASSRPYSCNPYGEPLLWSHGVQLQSLWATPAAESRLTAAIPMGNPCCSCKLSGVLRPGEVVGVTCRQKAAAGRGGAPSPWDANSRYHA